MSDAWGSLKTYVGFDDVEDGARLRALWPTVQPFLGPLLDRFYEAVLACEGTRRVLKDEAQVERLSCSLRGWLEDMFLGPHDEAYALRQRRIGRRHVEVGLAGQYMPTAMEVLGSGLTEILVNDLPAAELPAALVTLRRVLALELAVMTASYVDEGAMELQQVLLGNVRANLLLVGEDGLVTAGHSRPEGLVDPTAVGKPWLDALPADLVTEARLQAQVSALRSRVGMGADPVLTLPRVDVARSGRIMSYRVDLVFVGRPLAAFLVQVEDLTAAVELEAKVGRGEALAQLGALSAAVAHELRNPLAGISGAVQVISRSLPPDAPHAPVLAKVSREIRRLDALVSDLLAFARPGAGRRQPVDLRGPAERAVELSRVDASGVAFTVTGSGWANADPDLVHQILLNLIQNAVAAVSGEGRVDVLVDNGVVRVSDDGPGIPAELRDSVFEPFFTTKTRGTGLGLAICRRFAASMDGSVALDDDGEGTLPGATLALRLPELVGETP